MEIAAVRRGGRYNGMFSKARRANSILCALQLVCAEALSGRAGAARLSRRGDV